MSLSRFSLLFARACVACKAPPCIEDGTYLVDIGDQVPLEGRWSEQECPAEVEFAHPASVTLLAKDPGFQDDGRVCSPRDLEWEGQTRSENILALGLTGYGFAGIVHSASFPKGPTCDATMFVYLFYGGWYVTFGDALAGAEAGDTEAFRWAYLLMDPECLPNSVRVPNDYCARVFRADVEKQ